MLAKDYFGQIGMLAYVKGVQRIEIRNNVAAVKHQVNNFDFLKRWLFTISDTFNKTEMLSFL